MTEEQRQDAVRDLRHLRGWLEQASAPSGMVVRLDSVAALLATPAPGPDLTACANCMRPKCEHNGKLCPPPYTTHWTAWDYKVLTPPIFPEYATPAKPVTNEQSAALKEWFEKTAWVQEHKNTFPFRTLGKHRADIMREEIERLRALEPVMRTALDALEGARDALADETTRDVVLSHCDYAIAQLKNALGAAS